MLEKISRAAKVGIVGSLIGIAGCSKTSVEDSVSVISAEGKRPIETLGEVNPINTGFYTDMDSDGINDFLIFRGNTLYFSKGLGNNSYQTEVSVVKVKEPVIAYRIDTPPKPRKPYFVYFNSSRQGFLQENMGLNSMGRPIFADAEATSGFDF